MARLVAASIIVFIVGRMFAADVFWTGATDTKWSNAANWFGASSSRPLPTNDGMHFWQSRFDDRFTENIVALDGPYVNNYISWISGVGSSVSPLVFRAESTDCGLYFSGSDKSLYVANNNDDFPGDAFVKFEGGKWSCGYLKVGTPDYVGAIGLFDASFSVFRDFVPLNCRLSGNNGGKMSIDGYFIVGSSSGTAESFADIAGCEVVNVDKYLNVGNSSPGKITIRDGGRYACSQDVIVGNAAHGTLVVSDGGKVELGGKAYFGNGNSGSASVSVKSGGVFKAADSIFVGQRSAAALAIDGGIVEAGWYIYFCHTSDCGEGEDCSISVNNGGVLATRMVTCGSGVAKASLMLNGGTLKANVDGTLIANKDNLSVVVAANGGTIDTAGHVVEINKEMTGEGSVAFAGGGSAGLRVLPSCKGRLSVEVGTLLKLPSAVDGEKLAFAIPQNLADGEYPVVSITGNGRFADDVSGKCDVVAPKNKKATFYLSDDGKTIFCRSKTLSGFAIVIK